LVDILRILVKVVDLRLFRLGLCFYYQSPLVFSVWNSRGYSSALNQVMIVFVTGIAGFIGSRTAEMLLEQGHQVIGIDNLNSYYDVRLKCHRVANLVKAAGGDASELYKLSAGETLEEGFSLESIETGSLEFHQGSVDDLEFMDKILADRKVDVIINLAAQAGVRYSLENPHVYMSTNADGTLKVLELMRLRGIKKMVLASTSSLYAGQPMPFLETLPVNTPISPYAATKKAAEAMAYTYHHLYGLDISVVRYFTVFGPAGRPDMAPYRFVKWVSEETPITLFGDGEQARDFTYIDDIATGTIAAMKDVGYSVFNLGGGNNPVSINTTIEWIESFIGKKAKIDRKPFVKGDMVVTYADIQKAKAELEWEPQFDIKDGFARTAEWYLRNQDWLRKLPV
jgi:UDP-glucuronate 4-epimerase